MEKFKDLLKLLLPVIISLFIEGIGTTGEFITHMASLTGIAFLVPIITQALKTWWKAEGFGAQLISWVTSILLVFLSWFVGWGFIEYVWWELIFIGLGIGLAANGIFDINVIKMLLEVIFPKKTT